MKVKFGWLIFKFCSCVFQVVCSQCDRESQGSYPEVWGTDHHFWSAGSQVSQRTKYSADARYENPWNCIILHSCGSSLQWWKFWNYQLKNDENIHAAYFFWEEQYNVIEWVNILYTWRIWKKLIAYYSYTSKVVKKQTQVSYEGI